MTIRRKIALVLGLSMLILISMIHFFGRSILRSQVRAQETADINKDIERVITFYDDEEGGFGFFTNSESFRTEVARFLDPAVKEPIDAKAIAPIFILNQCDIVASADGNGRVLRARMFDRRSGRETALPADFQEQIESLLTLRQKLAPAEDFNITLAFDKNPYLAVIHPPLKQSRENLGDSLLIAARKIDGEFMSRLGRLTNLPMKRRSLIRTELPPEVKAALNAGTDKFTTAAQIISPDVISGFIQVRAPNHVPVLLMSFEYPRILNSQFNRSWNIFAGISIAAILAIIILSGLFIEKMAIRRLSKLAAFVKTIDSNADTASRVPVEGGDEIAGLAVSINGMLESIHGFNLERRDLIQRLESDSLEDSLTGLYNRRGFLMIAKEYLNLSARNKARMHLLFLDMDSLKKINDTFGHAMGDEALIRSAEIIKSVFRGSDVKSRLGGDEFAVFPIASSAEGLKSALSRFQEKISEFNRSGLCPFTLSFSSGVAVYDPEKPSTIDDLLDRADKKMYEEKRRKADRPGRV